MNQQTADAILDGFVNVHKDWIAKGMPDSRFLYFGLSKIINGLVSEDECEWKQWDDWDNSDTWNTGCGQDFCGWEGVPPEEHGVNFCQHCGKPVKWQPLPAPPKEGNNEVS